MVSSDAIVVWLENVRKDDIHIVGGKCANLGELTAKGVTVPPGFAVTADAFRRFLEETKIGEVIQKTLTSADGPRDPKQYEEASQAIRKIIESAPMPPDIASEVRSAYRDLERKTSNPQVKVAVRSSATSEDLPDASFAGQQDTYLNVKGEDALVHYVQKCWSSLYTPRAIFYREEKGFPHEKVLISVGVQKMVESEVSGVIFTLDPVNGDPSKIIIESSWGLGEALVAGVVRPDRFIVDKGTLQIVHKEIVPKMVEHVPNHETGLTMEGEVPAERLEDAWRMMKDKDILLTRMTNPDWVPYMKIAGAIVTEDGGTTCHAAIVSREMGIPCIVGARNATKLLQTGKEYTVDAKAGVVYQ